MHLTCFWHLTCFPALGRHPALQACLALLILTWLGSELHAFRTSCLFGSSTRLIIPDLSSSRPFRLPDRGQGELQLSIWISSEPRLLCGSKVACRSAISLHAGSFDSADRMKFSNISPAQHHKSSISHTRVFHHNDISHSLRTLRVLSTSFA